MERKRMTVEEVRACLNGAHGDLLEVAMESNPEAQYVIRDAAHCLTLAMGYLARTRGLLSEPSRLAEDDRQQDLPF